MSITIQNTKNNKTGYEVAKMLLDIKAVNFRPDEPYILTSGCPVLSTLTVEKLSHIQKNEVKLWKLR